MRVQFIKAREIGTVGADGPEVRVFSVGDVVDQPEMHAVLFTAEGVATFVDDDAPEVEAKPKARTRKPAAGE